MTAPEFKIDQRLEGTFDDKLEPRIRDFICSKNHNYNIKEILIYPLKDGAKDKIYVEFQLAAPTAQRFAEAAVSDYKPHFEGYMEGKMESLDKVKFIRTTDIGRSRYKLVAESAADLLKAINNGVENEEKCNLLARQRG